METQVFMKDKLQELFGDCFGGAEQTQSQWSQSATIAE